MSARNDQCIWSPRNLTPEQYDRANGLADVIERPGIRRHDARDIAALVVRQYVTPADMLAGEAHHLLRLLTDSGALEFAHGTTTTDKVLDLARDLEAALTAYENTEEP